MTPLLEEIEGYVEDIFLLSRNKKWQNIKLIIPKNVTLEEIRDKLRLQGSVMVSYVMKSRIPGTYLFDKFGHESAQKIYEMESPNPDSWVKNFFFAFIVYFLGPVIFSRGVEEDIHTRLITVANALCNGVDRRPCTIVPMIVADIYRALGYCKNGVKLFEECNLLLQLWLIEHLQKVHGMQELYKPTGAYNIIAHHFRVTIGVKRIKRPIEVEKWGQILSALIEDSVQWMFDWFYSTNFVIYAKHQVYLILMGLHGFQSYALARVMRQAGRKQIIPKVTNMEDHRADYLNDKIPHATDIAKIWNKKTFLDDTSIAPKRYHADYATGYIQWLLKDLEGTAISSVKRGRHVSDKEAEPQALYNKFKRRALEFEARN